MNKVITISREYGAGGHSIGRQVAEELGIRFYDKTIVNETAKASGLDPDLIRAEEEDVSKTGAILRSICSSSVYYYDTQDTIREVQKAVIRKIAQEGPCVILGRCADAILRETEIETLNVFIHADEIHRAMRVGEMLETTNATEIQRTLAKKDASRRNYYNRYTGNKWGIIGNYHLALDSGILGYDTCVKLIVAAAKAGE